MAKRGDYGLKIAHTLLTDNKPMTVAEICNKTGCDRKTVYKNIDMIEIAGFLTEVKRKGNTNFYSILGY